MKVRHWHTWLSFAGGFLLWEIVGRYVVTNPIFFAPFSQVVEVTFQRAVAGELFHHIWISLSEFLLGFGLSMTVGIGLGIAMALNNTLRRILDPWVAFFYSSPLVALMPFFIVVFGIGLGSKVAIVFTVSVFPILLNTVTGMRSVEPHFLEVANAFDCKQHQVLTKVLLPAAQPYIMVGLRLGVGRALTGVVVGELFASQAGLGNLISAAGQSFDTPALLMGVMIFSLVGVALMQLINQIDRWLAPWRFNADGEPI